jgi:hypothetical protein
MLARIMDNKARSGVFSELPFLQQFEAPRPDLTAGGIREYDISGMILPFTNTTMEGFDDAFGVAARSVSLPLTTEYIEEPKAYLGKLGISPFIDLKVSTMILGEDYDQPGGKEAAARRVRYLGAAMTFDTTQRIMSNPEVKAGILGLPEQLQKDLFNDIKDMSGFVANMYVSLEEADTIEREVIQSMLNRLTLPANNAAYLGRTPTYHHGVESAILELEYRLNELKLKAKDKDDPPVTPSPQSAKTVQDLESLAKGGTKSVRLKPGVRLYGMRPEIAVGMSMASSVYESHGLDMVVTSVADGTHNRKSLHYKGLAFDVRTRNMDVVQQNAVVTDLERVMPTGWDIVLESDHIHVEYDWKGPEGG